ncbi:MAG: hypothetical protein E7240_06575 [Lachnospiraceae bacterium]|nr:hypothetical protein [Lachnospiraceae bacterium]
MTRQKKELIRKIDEIEEWIRVDEALGCGCAPAGAYDSMYEEIHRLTEELARLSHYESAEEMMNDTRWMVVDDALPFH